MKNAIVFVAVCLVAAVTLNLLAQSRSHDQIMKDVNVTFAALKKNIDSSSAAAVREDAAKLSGLFKEVEVFWTPLRSKTAVEAAKRVQTAAEEIAAAAKANDLKLADATYGGIGKTCKACHDRHRVQMPDKSFKIRP